MKRSRYRTVGYIWKTTTILVWISPLRWESRQEVTGESWGEKQGWDQMMLLQEKAGGLGSNPLNTATGNGCSWELLGTVKNYSRWREAPTIRVNQKKRDQEVLSQREVVGRCHFSGNWEKIYQKEKQENPQREQPVGQAGVPCTFCISNLPLPWRERFSPVST